MARRLVLMLALCTAGALVAACGGDLSGDPDVPSSWQTVEAGSVTFRVPEDWKVTREPAEDGAQVVEARGPGAPDTAPIARLLVERAPGSSVDTMKRLRDNADESLPEADLEEPKDVELEGAEKAARWTTTYKAPAGAGAVNGLAAEREDGSSLFLRTLALDSSDVDTAKIADSVRLG